MMDQPVQQRSGQTLAAQHLGPFGKGKITGHERGTALIELTKNFKQ